MKIQIIILLAAIVYCNCQSPTPASVDDIIKQNLLQRIAQEETRINFEINILLNENRGHLALVLEDELKRIQALGNELRTSSPGPEALRLLEEEMFAVILRVDQEVNNLLRESATQQQLLFAAQILQAFVAQEIFKLENTTGRDRERAQQGIDTLRREETRLQQLVAELVAAQEPQRIAALEVEVRAIETRVEEELRRLGFTPASLPPPPSTARPPTAAPSSPRPLRGV